MKTENLNTEPAHPCMIELLHNYTAVTKPSLSSLNYTQNYTISTH